MEQQHAKNYNYHQHWEARQARPRQCGRPITHPCCSSSWSLAFSCRQIKYLIKNQPIHDQLLLYCLVKWKYSRGTADKKEVKAILEIVCWPRRYIFPHQTRAARDGGGGSEYLYRLGISRGGFPASLTNQGKGTCVACVRAWRSEHKRGHYQLHAAAAEHEGKGTTHLNAAI